MESIRHNKVISMMTLVSHVIKVNQFLGVFPMEIRGNIVVFRWKSLKFFKTVLNLVILSLYLIFVLFQYFKSMYEGEGMVGLVVLSIWKVKTFITILVLVIGIFKRNQFTYIFQHAEDTQHKLVGFVNCQHAVNYSRRIYGLYVAISVVTLGFCIGHAILDPKAAYSIIHYVEEPNQAQILLNCFFQFYLQLVAQAAFSFMEVLCPSLARSISGSILRIREEMLKALEKKTFSWNDKDLDLDSTISTAIFQRQEKSFPAILSPAGVEKGGNGTQPIMKALERFILISEKQGLINSIFGPVLALNTAWLTLNVCLLFFLEIRFLNPASGKTVDNLAEKASLFVVLLVIWNACTVTVRLFIVLISLGKVYHASQCFDSSLLNSLIGIERPRQVDLQLIQVHLISNGANPLCFSAGGYFIFSRQTILYVISIVTTYLVFLLQA